MAHKTVRGRGETSSAVRGRERGVVLINVLVILALTAAIVTAMVSLSDVSITRSQRYSEAGQGLALIAAGETSAIVALRRDMAETPGIDHPGEAWGKTGQQDVAIEGGRFALRIEDAQARFNLNSLPGSGAFGVQMVQRIAAALDLAPDVAPRIAARLAQQAPLERLGDLVSGAGLTPAEVARLSELVTVLPGRTDININTAPDALLAVLADNPVQAQSLQATRSRNGFLTQADVTAAGMILPPGAGYASRFYLVTVQVTVGGTQQSRLALLQRRQGRGGRAEVVVIEREAASAPLLPVP